MSLTTRSVAALAASLGCIALYAGPAWAQQPGTSAVPAVVEEAAPDLGGVCVACDWLEGDVQPVAGLSAISVGTGMASAASTSTCYFETRGDYVHRTGSDASGHGWWVNFNCPTSLADVRIWLQQYYSDGSWRNRGSTGYKRVYSGGGSANRANARAGCDSSSLTSWRSVVDVDLVGLSDSSEVLVTPTQTIYCRDL